MQCLWVLLALHCLAKWISRPGGSLAGTFAQMRTAQVVVADQQVMAWDKHGTHLLHVHICAGGDASM